MERARQGAGSMSAPKPTAAPPEMRPFPPRIARLDDAAVERFAELAGFHLSDDVRPDLADQMAMRPTLEWVRDRPVQGGAA